MSYWSEIRSDFEEEVGVYLTQEQDGDMKLRVSIDAWKTDDDNEEGRVIARVIVTKSNDIVIDYIDNIARTDKYAQEVIKETVDRLREENPQAG